MVEERGLAVQGGDTEHTLNFDGKWFGSISVAISISLLAIIAIYTFVQDNRQPSLTKPKLMDRANPTAGDPVDVPTIKEIRLPPPPAPTIRSQPANATRLSVKKRVQPRHQISGTKKASSKKIKITRDTLISKPELAASEREPLPDHGTPKTPINKKPALDGRVLLRMLEHDKGPHVSFAWPDNKSIRQRLFQTFTQCLGVRVALMDKNGKLYRADDRPGESWPINLDTYSGFVRRPHGAITKRESGLIKNIRRNHNPPSPLFHVRIFPRWLDAELLGRIRTVIGDGYMQTSNVTARYQISSGTILVRDIRADGKSMPGNITLPIKGHC